MSGFQGQLQYGVGGQSGVEGTPKNNSSVTSGAAFYNNGPFFSLLEGFGSFKAKVIARYPNQDVVASGWLRGEEAMAGRAAVVSVDLNPGRVVLFGLRPQHRAQTHATFPMLFNALYTSASPVSMPTTDQ